MGLKRPLRILFVEYLYSPHRPYLCTIPFSLAPLSFNLQKRGLEDHERSKVENSNCIPLHLHLLSGSITSFTTS